MRLPASPFASELVANLDSYPLATIASQTLTEHKAREVEHDACKRRPPTRLPSLDREPDRLEFFRSFSVRLRHPSKKRPKSRLMWYKSRVDYLYGEKSTAVFRKSKTAKT